MLAPYASLLAEADAELAPRVTPELLTEVLALVPADWLTAADFETADAARAAYLEHLSRRVARTADWLPQGSAA